MDSASNKDIKPCVQCGAPRSKPDEKYCAACKKKYLKEMRQKHPQDPFPKTFSDERGRKSGRSSSVIGGAPKFDDYEQDN